MPKFSSNSERTAFEWAQSLPLDQITDMHVQIAYRLNLKPCFQKPNSCKRNCRGNPRCLYGLGEKKWLTNKDEDFLTDFENPNDERKKEGTFVGLKNLGATCYVNSLLQVWFHNPFLREAIYKWKPEDDQKEIREQLNKSLQEVELIGCKKNGNFTPVSPVGQLQLIFTRLQFSLRCFVDPTQFVNTLDLDVSTQQDAQEFSKLFLTLLEEDLSNQKNATVRNIVQTQYRGEYVYITRCQNCLTESKSPSNFYELGLNIKGHKDIYECLEEFFAPEILEGSNQFFCNTCQSKQNVVRFVKLKKLPPYLNLQLLRFVFDRQKGRRKLNSFIKFPETLSLSKYFDLNESEVADNSDYDLCAVLMHRGQSAHSGHYIAQIKDRITEDWFKFNDEFVEKIEGKNLKLGFEENSENCVYSESKSSSPTEDKQMPKLNKGQHASNDAYMLVYKRSTLDDKSLPPDDSFKWDIPEYLQTVLLEDNTQFEERVEVYNQLKNQNLAVNKEKQDEIKTVFEQLIQNDRLLDCEWISKDWLCHWLSFDLSAPISCIENTSAVCAHNRLSIGAVDQMKLINSKGADLIFAKYGGDLRLKNCLCLECVQNKAQSIQRRHKINEDSKRITSLLKFSLPISETAYWVGKESLKVWKHLALKQCDLFESSFMLNKSRSNSTSDAINLHPESGPGSCLNGESASNIQNSSSENGDSDSENKPPSQSDRLNEIFIDQINFNFNEDILCPHLRLTYDDTKRRLVSPSVWNLLKSHFFNASEFDSEAAPCEECLTLSITNQSIKNEQKVLALNQKQQLGELYSQKRKITYEEMNPGFLYYALNTEFFTIWKNFIRDPSHNEAPNLISNLSLLCEHKLLLHPPERIDHNTLDFKYIIVSSEDWSKLAHFYDSDCTIKFAVQFNANHEKYIESDPKCCETCYAQLKQIEQESLLNYEKATIHVRRIQSKCDTEDVNDDQSGLDDDRSDKSFGDCVPKKFKKVASDSNPLMYTGGDCKKPRRSSRRRKYRDVKELIVSSADTLLQLKIQIMKVFKIPPYDQNLILNEVLLEGNEKTLSELDIIPNSLICLKADEPAGGFTTIEEDFIKGAIPETGFKGTKLCNREDD